MRDFDRTTGQLYNTGSYCDCGPKVSKVRQHNSLIIIVFAVFT